MTAHALILLTCLLFLLQEEQTGCRAQVSEVDARVMADQISYIFDVYATNFTGHRHAQALFDTSHVTISRVDGGVEAASIAARIEDVLRSYEELLFQLQSRLERKKRRSGSMKSGANSNNLSLQQVPGYEEPISLETDSVWMPERGELQDEEELSLDFTWSSSLLTRWTSLLKFNQDIHSLYFGGRSGLVRMYPGRGREGDTMDARYMPWYAAAATPGRDVVFVLDASHSMSEENYWKETVQGVSYILHSLSDTDFVQLVLSQDSRVSRFSCAASHGLTRATIDTKLALLSWLESIQPSGELDLKGSIQEMYSIFSESVDSMNAASLHGNSSGNCVKVAFLVGSSPSVVKSNVEEWIDEIGADLEITVHSWLVGKAVQTAKEHASEDFYHSSGGFYEASCQTSGVWHAISSNNSLSSSMLHSYEYLVAGFSREQPLWQLGLGADYSLFSSQQNQTVLLSVSIPVYDSSEEYPVVLGVLGMDVRLDALLRILENERIGLSYAFLASRYGEVVSHPRAPDVGSVVLPTAPFFYDLELIEPGFHRSVARVQLVQQISGNISCVADVPIPRGDTGEGFLLKEKKQHFFWRRVNSSPFILVLALTEQNLVKRVLEPSNPILPSAFRNAHILQLRKETAFLPPGFFFSVIPDLVPYGIAGASFTYSTVSGTYHTGLLGDGLSFIHAVRGGDLELTRRALAYLNALPLTTEMLQESNLSRAELLTNPAFGRDITNMVRITARMDPFWRVSEILSFRNAFLYELRGALLWSVVGTDPGGLLRIWPGFPQTYNDLNPYSQSWFLRAASSPGLLALSQPFRSPGEDDDPNRSVGRVITISRALHYDSADENEDVLGAVASYLDYERFYNVTLRNVGCPVDRLNNGGIQCLLLGPDGSMLMMPEFNSLDRFTFLDNSQKTPNDLLFLGFREPELAGQLIAAGFMTLQQKLNYRTQQIEYYYVVSPRAVADDSVITGSLSMNNSAGYCTIASSYHVLPVSGTNTHLIVFNGYYYTEEGCTTLSPPDPTPMLQDSCEVNGRSYPRPEPECVPFRVSPKVLEDRLREDKAAKCEQSENPELVWIEWSDPAAIAATCLAACIIGFTLITLGILVYFRREPVVYCSTPLFIYFIHAGAFLAYTAVLLGIGKPSELSCNTQLWMSVLAFVFIFGSLSVKTLRVWLIIRSRSSFTVVVVSNKELLKYLLLLLALPLLVLIIWTSMEPLKPIAYDDNVDSDKQTLRCGSESELLSYIFGSMLASYALVMMLFVSVLAFKVRNCVLNFKESKLMAASIYNFVLLVSTGVALSFVLRGTPVASFLVFSVGVLLGTFFTVFILFIQKFYILYLTNGDNNDVNSKEGGEEVYITPPRVKGAHIELSSIFASMEQEFRTENVSVDSSV